MNEELAWRKVERYSYFGSFSQDDNVDSVAQALAIVIRHQQKQIEKLQDIVGQLVTINNNATLNDN